jgi:hypothetical protein
MVRSKGISLFYETIFDTLIGDALKSIRKSKIYSDMISLLSAMIVQRKLFIFSFLQV